MQFAAHVGIGEYRIERALGDGRYEARHLSLARRVILKVNADASVLLREASALERLRHPRVPRVYECASTWIAIERVDVAPLGRPDDATLAIRDLAAILEHAHARGVVHGDVRADACGWRDGEAWLVDWSSAAIDGDAAARALDIAALGELSRALVGDAASPRTAALITRMTDADARRRPSAADVRVALDGSVTHDDVAPPVEDIVLSEDLSASDTKMRWTPMFGLAEIPESPTDEAPEPNDRRPDRYRAR